MILHEATFKKFGYWPDGLGGASKKKVVACCDVCNRTYYVRVKNSGLCRNCSMSKLHRDTLIPPSNKKITVNELVDIFFQGSLIWKGNSVNIVVKNKVLGCGITRQLLHILNINQKHTNTESLKKGLHNLLINKSNIEIFEILNYIFSKKRKIGRGYNNWYGFYDSTGIIISLMDKLKFTYKKIDYRRFQIIKGSFFLNEEWLHIDG